MYYSFFLLNPPQIPRFQYGTHIIAKFLDMQYIDLFHNLSFLGLNIFQSFVIYSVNVRDPVSHLFKK
jgi:hypothetical protein